MTRSARLAVRAPGETVAASLLRAGTTLLRALGPARSSNLAGRLARAIGPRLPVSRIAHDNLRAALPHLTPGERARVVRQAWENLGRTVGEFPHLGDLDEVPPADGALPRDAGEPGWELEGAEILRAVAASPAPSIFVSAHLGNWEVLPAVASRYGVRFGLLYRAAESSVVDAWTVALRRRAARAAMPVFPKGARGAREALGFLGRGGALGLLMDQKMNDGIEARFFGRPAMTAPALAALALRYGCPVVPAHCRRIGPARFQVTVEPPMTLPDTGDRQADILALTQAVNDRLEAWVREWPEGWLWMHRRWPRQA